MLRQDRYTRFDKTENGLRGTIWDVALSALSAGGGLFVLLEIWGSLAPSFLFPALAAFGAIVICLLFRRFSENPQFLWGARLIPFAALVLLLGPSEIWQGLLLWLNCGITLWNKIHDGGIPLYAASATADSVAAFSVVAALLLGQLFEGIISRRRLTAGCAAVTVLNIISLMTGTFNPFCCAALIIALLGAWCSGSGKAPSVQAMRPFVICTVVFAVIAALIPEGELTGVTRSREQLKETVSDIRYGKDTLPEGRLDMAGELHADGGEIMTVFTEQEKALYLRGFVGGTYKDGDWTELADSAYTGEYSGMLDWLSEQGFDPLTQPAEYQRLCGDDAPEQNRVLIDMADGSRRYIYAPATVSETEQKKMSSKKDSRLKPYGFFGEDKYTLSELSDSVPSELTVRAEWVGHPETDEQKSYAEAEAFYRDFVFKNYLQVDSSLSPVINELFWSETDEKNDSIYSAVSRVREVLSARTENTSEGELSADIGDFLAGKRRGNAVLYASAAAQALRCKGIPSRYVEGYYVSSSDVMKGGANGVSVMSDNAHAWVEIYFDGIGWLPVDVTPGYYYDAVTLQQMVGAPDTVKKTAVLDDAENDLSGIAGDGSTWSKTFSEVLLELRNVLLVFCGIVAALTLAATVLFLIFELFRSLHERKEAHDYKKASPRKKVMIMYKCLCRICAICGIDLCLGYNSAEIDGQIADRFSDVAEGDYLRAAALMEKSIYGGIALEPYEMRTVEALLGKVTASEQKRRKVRLKMRYCSLAKEKKRKRPSKKPA